MTEYGTSILGRSDELYKIQLERRDIESATANSMQLITTLLVLLFGITAAVIIRAKWMGQAGTEQTDIGVLRNRVIRGDPRREQCQGKPHRQDQQAPRSSQPAITKTKAQAQAPRGNQRAAAHCIFTRGSRATVTSCDSLSIMGTTPEVDKVTRRRDRP